MNILVTGATGKEDRARQLAERDGSNEGLVCVFSILENCRSFSLRFSPGRRFLRPASRKCLHFYYYFMDRDFGLIHVRIQSWFPMQIQVYLCGRGNHTERHWITGGTLRPPDHPLRPLRYS